jgi:hypothetical protein
MMLSMRTTLNNDDDLLRQLKQRAAKSRTPLRRLVNTALRAALTRSRATRVQKPYTCRVFRMGEPTIGLDKALALAASLEDAEVLRELELRK